MTEYKHGKRFIGYSATDTEVFTAPDGQPGIRVLDSEPIYIDCNGSCDLDVGTCECPQPRPHCPLREPTDFDVGFIAWCLPDE